MSVVEHRYFFALLPPTMVAREIFGLSLALGRGRRVLQQHLHLTMAVTPDSLRRGRTLPARWCASRTSWRSGPFPWC